MMTIYFETCIGACMDAVFTGCCAEKIRRLQKGNKNA